MELNNAEDAIVQKLRESLCMDPDDLIDVIGLAPGPRVDSGSFDKLVNIDEDDNPYIESTTKFDNSEYTLIDSKEEA